MLSIEEEREQRKNDNKIKKLKGAVRTMKSLELYSTVLNDPLFDRSMLDTILTRLKDKTAFKNNFNNEAKQIIKLIVEHPLITVDDLMFITSIKAEPRPGSYYNSSYINSTLVNKSDAPKSAIIALIKKPQYDIKVKALKRKDLTSSDIDMILQYSINHHSHMPSQMKEILASAGKLSLLEDETFKKEIIENLKKKYTIGTNRFKKPNGINFFETVAEYGWINEITKTEMDEIFTIIIEAYKNKAITKNRIDTLINNYLGEHSGEFLFKIYNETKDESFFPPKVVDVFLF